jgi:transcriptional regulator with XRE-family HTH domain
MGYPIWRPKRLARKLLQIRNKLDLSQSELLEKLGLANEIEYTRISDYETDKTAPPLPVLVEYARVAGVHVEEIADDRLHLPKKLPGDVMYEAWNRPRPKRRKKKTTKAKK